MDQTVEDGNAVDELLKASGLKFVIVRPSVYMGKGARPVKVLGDNGEDAGFMPSITPESVANFLVTAVTTNEFDGRTPVISS